MFDVQVKKIDKNQEYDRLSIDDCMDKSMIKNKDDENQSIRMRKKS